MPEAIPPLLNSFVSTVPEHSLTLITSVLGATSNWLLLRFLYPVLSNTSQGPSTSQNAGDRKARVVLVSFLRGLDFWKAESRRLGIDLQRLATEKRFIFIDGLTSLFVPQPTTTPPAGTQAADPGTTTLHWTGTLTTIESSIVSALSSSATSPTYLLIDSPDALLATTTPTTTASSLTDMLMTLRQHAHATVITAAADGPLLFHGEGAATELEVEHMALVVGLAHQSRTVLQLRGLETGVARDVSGVLRASKGGMGDGDGEKVEEKELLYFVQGDGGVKVFGRGE